MQLHTLLTWTHPDFLRFSEMYSNDHLEMGGLHTF